jgi:hypothetical protein
MANAQNLKTLSPSEAREYGRQGGIKSGEVRRGNKRIKEVLDNLLHAPADQQWVGELHKILPPPPYCFSEERYI